MKGLSTTLTLGLGRTLVLVTSTISAFEMSEATEKVESAIDILEISLLWPLVSGIAMVKEGLCLTFDV